MMFGNWGCESAGHSVNIESETCKLGQTSFLYAKVIESKITLVYKTSAYKAILNVGTLGESESGWIYLYILLYIHVVIVDDEE